MRLADHKLLPATRDSWSLANPPVPVVSGPPRQGCRTLRPAAVAARRRLEGPPRATAAGASRAGGCHSTSSAAVRFSDSPYQSGVAVWGPYAGCRQTRVGRRQRRPLPARRRWLRRQRHAVRAQEPELPGGVSYHLKALFVHRAVVEPAAQHQVLQPGLPAVGPVHDVVGVAVAGVAAGELALAAIAVQQGAAQGGRDRTRPAADLRHLAVGAVAQRHEGGIAGDAAGRLPAQVQLPAR